MKLEIKESILFGIKEIRNEGSSLNDGDWYEIIRRVNLHDELIENLKEIREWYENHTILLNGITPICFSKALSLIQKASTETQGDAQKH